MDLDRAGPGQWLFDPGIAYLIHGQLYNVPDHYERLADALLALL